MHTDTDRFVVGTEGENGTTHLVLVDKESDNGDVIAVIDPHENYSLRSRQQIVGVLERALNRSGITTELLDEETSAPLPGTERVYTVINEERVNFRVDKDFWLIDGVLVRLELSEIHDLSLDDFFDLLSERAGFPLMQQPTYNIERAEGTTLWLRLYGDVSADAAHNERSWGEPDENTPDSQGNVL